MNSLMNYSIESSASFDKEAKRLGKRYVSFKEDYLKLLAGRMSLEVIDTFCCGICDIYEKKNANGRYLIDGLHPNAAGAKKIGVFNASAVIASYR